MKKEYSTPIIEIVVISQEDVLTSSDLLTFGNLMDGDTEVFYWD